MFTDPTEVHDLQPFINDAIKVIKEEIYEEIPNDIHVKAECSYESFGADIKTESLEESTSDEQDTEDHYSTAKNIKLETPEECGITYQLVKFWPVGNSSEDSSEQRQQSQDVTSSRCRDSSSTKQIIDDSDCIVLSSDESSLDEVKLNNCDTKFPQQNEICNHKSVDTPIQCNICDKTFNHEDNLEQHGAAHSSDRKYKCTGCEISCTTFNKLKDHKYNHCKNRKYQCMVCDKLFETSYAVETHFQLIHNIRNNYKCDVCNKEYETPENLSRHKLVHSSKKNSTPNHCISYSTDDNNKSDTDINSFGKRKLRNQAIHINIRKHRCDLCDKAFVRAYDLMRHRLLPHGKKKNNSAPAQNSSLESDRNKVIIGTSNEEVKKYKCGKCDSAFMSPYLLKRHMLRGHRSKKYRSTKKHISRGNHDNSNAYTRGSCNEILTGSGGTRVYKCDLCEKTYTQVSSVNRHKLSVHNNEMNNKKERLNRSTGPYVSCNPDNENDINKKVFADSNTAVYNKVECSSIKKHKCNICGKAFRWSSNLSRHRLSVHKNEINKKKGLTSSSEPHVSFNPDNENDINKKEFSGNNPAVYHVANHRKYKCNLCGRTFRWPSDMKRHTLTHKNKMNKKKKGLTSCSEPHVSFNRNNENDINKKVFSDTNPAVYCVANHRKYECNVCDKAFRWPSDMKRHMLTHKNKMNNKKKGLTSCSEPHISLNPDNKNDINKKAFADSNPVVYNKVEHSSIKKHKCNVCGKAFRWSSSMKRHILSVHKSELNNKRKGLSSVSEQHVSFNTDNENNINKKVFSDNNPANHWKYKCNVCARAFRWPSDMKRHTLSQEHKMNNKKKRLTSSSEPHVSLNPDDENDINKKTFTDSNPVIYNKVEQSSIKKHKCNVCGKPFRWSFSMKRHILSVHKSKMNNKRKGLTSSSEPHVSLNPDNENDINKETFTDSNPVIYNKVEQSSIKKHKCNVCGKAFRWSFSMKRHILSVHKSKMNNKRKGLTSSSEPHVSLNPDNENDINKKVYADSNAAVYNKVEQSSIKEHTCDICGKAFNWLSSMRRHKLCVHKNKKNGANNISQYFSRHNEGKSQRPVDSFGRKYKCNLCGRAFRCFSNLSRHRLSVHKKTAYEANKVSPLLSYHNNSNGNACIVADESQVKLCNKVVSTASVDEQYKCDICGKTFRRSITMSIHKFQFHGINNGIKKYKCSICDKVFLWHQSLKRHKLSVHKIKKNNKQKVFSGISETEDSAIRKYKCNLCDKTFVLRYILLRHELVTHGISSSRKKNKCDICGRIFKKSEYLSIHKFVYHNINSGVMKYKCSICDKVFLWSQSLKRHELSVHKNEKIGKQKVSSGNSETADSGMTRESQMIQHKSSVHENKDECYKDPSDLSRVLFQCADKTEIPTDPADLVKHNICDKNVEKFRCDVCGKNFKNPVNLTQHKVVHMNVKYNCNICSKSFSEPDLLLQHMSLHNGDGNSHQCNVCSKVFTNAQNLKRHKVLHKKIKIFKCNLCDYMFTKSFNLLQHKLTEHSVVREFNCDVCDRGFVTAELLSQHVLLHSDDN